MHRSLQISKRNYVQLLTLKSSMKKILRPCILVCSQLVFVLAAQDSLHRYYTIYLCCTRQRY